MFILQNLVITLVCVVLYCFNSHKYNYCLFNLLLVDQLYVAFWNCNKTLHEDY